MVHKTMKKYEEVIAYIYRGVQTGVLKQGAKLPSIRTLAERLGVSVTSVDAAYTRLIQLGVVESERRKGYWLVDTGKIPESNVADRPPSPFSDILLNYIYVTNKAFDGIRLLGSVSPPSPWFPSEELGKCLSRIARKFAYEVNVYGFARNTLRSMYQIEGETAGYIFNVHGLSVAGSEICHTSGATEAIIYALRAVTEPGDVVAVECPGFLDVFVNLMRYQLGTVGIRTSFPDGLDLDELEGKLKDGVRIKAVVVTPNFQNPTGATMPRKNRLRLLELRERYGFLLVEDDALGALRFGERIPSLKEEDPDEVVYVGSYSKTIAPGYRVGWAAGGKHAFNIQSLHMVESFEDALLGHMAVTEYVRGGKYVAHIERLRALYGGNCKEMAGLLRAHFPEGTDVAVPSGGQYVWVTLPEGVSASALYHEALKYNILLAPGVLFGEAPDEDRCLRFCYAMPLTPPIADAIEIVGKLACTP